jgi:hypothetical protein
MAFGPFYVSKLFTMWKATPLYLAVLLILTSSPTLAADGSPVQLAPDGSLIIPTDLKNWQLPPAWAVTSERDPESGPDNAYLKFKCVLADWGYQPTTLVLYPHEIARLVFAGRIKTDNVIAGTQSYMKAQACLQFLGNTGDMVGGWPPGTTVDGTTDWTPFRQDLACATGTRAVKISLGMCVSTGTAMYDSLRITAYDTAGSVVEPIPTPSQVTTNTTGWWTFNSGVEDTSRPLVIDLSRYIPAPAGKFGRVVVRNGHFAFANGGRARFWGSGTANWDPAKSDSDRIARQLVRDGINLVRFHGMDAQDRSKSIFDPNSDKTDRLDPVKLDLMDYHFANLKKHGIYVDLNLLTKRRYLAGDGVMDADKLPEGGKCAALFDSRLIQLQKDYDRLLLNHVNPYTGLAYKDDPAVAMVEIINETSLFSLGFMGGIPPSYESELNDLFKAWCAKNSVAPPTQTIVVLLDRRTPEAVRFAQSVESSYYQTMYDYLKKDIGLRAPITTTSFAYEVDEKRMQAQTDFIDAHAYHDTPAGGWEPTDSFENKPLVKTPQNIIGDLAAESVEGKPFTISEWNCVWSNQYITEGPFIMASYSGFQDWDAPMDFTVSGDGWQNKMDDIYVNDNKPHVMAPFIASAISYYRGDVKPGPLRMVDINRAGVGANAIDLYRQGSSDDARWLANRVRLGIDRPAGPPPPGAAAAGSSDQIHWDTKQGLFVVNTPSTQGLVGFTKGLTVPTGNTAIQIDNPFAQVIVTSLSSAPIATSHHLLITATAQAENTGETYRLFYKGLVNAGSAPILLEPVHACITLMALQGAIPKVYVLDWYGRRTNVTLPVSRLAGGRIRIVLGAQPGAWFEVVYGG